MAPGYEILKQSTSNICPRIITKPVGLDYLRNKVAISLWRTGWSWTDEEGSDVIHRGDLTLIVDSITSALR